MQRSWKAKRPLTRFRPLAFCSLILVGRFYLGHGMVDQARNLFCDLVWFPKCAIMFLGKTFESFVSFIIFLSIACFPIAPWYTVPFALAMAVDKTYFQNGSWAPPFDEALESCGKVMTVCHLEDSEETHCSSAIGMQTNKSKLKGSTCLQMCIFNTKETCGENCPVLMNEWRGKGCVCDDCQLHFEKAGSRKTHPRLLWFSRQFVCSLIHRCIQSMHIQLLNCLYFKASTGCCTSYPWACSYILWVHPDFCGWCSDACWCHGGDFSNFRGLLSVRMSHTT